MSKDGFKLMKANDERAYFYSPEDGECYYLDAREKDYNSFVLKLEAFAKFINSTEEFRDLRNLLDEFREQINSFNLSSAITEFSGSSSQEVADLAIRVEEDASKGRQKIDSIQGNVLAIHARIFRELTNPNPNNFPLAILQSIVRLITLILPVLRIFTFKQGQTNRERCQGFLKELNSFYDGFIKKELRILNGVSSSVRLKIDAPGGASDRESDIFTLNTPTELSSDQASDTDQSISASSTKIKSPPTRGGSLTDLGSSSFRPLIVDDQAVVNQPQPSAIPSLPRPTVSGQIKRGGSLAQFFPSQASNDSKSQSSQEPTFRAPAPRASDEEESETNSASSYQFGQR